MTETATLLTLLQHGDSFFPSGSLVFSGGLETLAEEGRIGSADEVESFLRAQIHGRWADFDRAVVAGAHEAAPDLAALAELDRLVEAQMLVRELREGSRMAGRALLGVHARLATAGAAAYREKVGAGEAPGHVAVVQGLLWRAVGLASDDALRLSAHQLCVGLLGAALRLGLIGHIDVQRIFAALHGDIVSIIDGRPLPAPQETTAFCPEADIAVMRHEAASSRLFAN